MLVLQTEFLREGDYYKAMTVHELPVPLLFLCHAVTKLRGFSGKAKQMGPPTLDSQSPKL
jgi:hypothetical protein